MGSMYVPSIRVDTIDMGTSPISNPENLLLSIDGVVYGNGYVNSPGTYQRQIFPTYDTATNKIYIKVINIASTASCPSLVLNNIEVLVIG